MNQLKKKIQSLNKSKVFIGYYVDQGEHKDSGLSYVDLMSIHEYGAPDVGIPSRPVLRLTEGGGIFSPEDKRQIREAFKGVFVKNIPVESALNQIGRYYQEKGRAIFGSGALKSTVKGNPPLIITSELKENFSYRTSFTYSTE